MRKIWFFWSVFGMLQQTLASGIFQNDVIQAFKNDDDIYRRVSFTFEDPSLKKPNSFNLGKEINLFEHKGKQITLLSKVFLGSAPSGVELTTQNCESLKQAYAHICQPETLPEKAQKIRLRDAQVAAWRADKSKSEEEIQGWIRWFKDQSEWGPIITQELQQEARIKIRKFVHQVGDNFLLRHTLSVAPDITVEGNAPYKLNKMNGLIVVYPGHNSAILEENFYTQSFAPPYAVAHLVYTVYFDTNRLHIERRATESQWLRRGHGYAMGRYLTDFAQEHLTSIIDLLTTSARHSVSERMNEKCGFKKLDREEAERLQATHARKVPLHEWERHEKIVAAWGTLPERYQPWLNENFPRIFPDQYHEMGYKYF